MEKFLYVITFLFLIAIFLEDDSFKERTYTIGLLGTLGMAVAIYLVK